MLTRCLPDVLTQQDRWRARWYWQHWDNPYRCDRPAGWVLADGDRVLGHLGAVYVPIRVGGKLLTGVIGTDYAVADEAIARGGVFAGLELAQKLFDTCSDCVVMATTANDKTGAVFSRFGGQVVDWTKEFWRAPATLRQQIRSCHGSRNRILRRLLHSPLGPAILRHATYAYETMGTRPNIPLPPGCWIETTVPQLARDIGNLCNRVADAPDSLTPREQRKLNRADVPPTAGWTIDRSPSYLDWRYARHPEREHLRVLVMRDCESNPIGAVIVFNEDRADRRITYIEDLITLPHRHDVMRALFCAALRSACDHKAKYLVTMSGGHAIRHLFWELGFKGRSRNAPAAVIQPAPANLGDETLTAPEPLHEHVEFWHGVMF